MRNSNLELLRIISMLLIVAHHYSVHGFYRPDLYYSINKYIVDFLTVGGKIGVNCFILISGYFMVNSKITIKKLLKLDGQVVFYSIGIIILFSTILTPVEYISIKNIIKAIFPIIFNQYWFVTNYIILMILSPWLNIFIKFISKEDYLKLICLLTFLWSFLLTLIPINTLGYSSLGWFILLYLIAGYIRKYLNISLQSPKRHFKIAVAGLLIYVLSVIIFNIFGYTFNIKLFLLHSTYLARDNSILLLIISIELFIGFNCLKEWKNKFINIIATGALGVYLIHDNIYLRTYLWKNIFNNESMYASSVLIFHAIFAILTIYTICTIIDLVRQKTIEKIYMYIVDKFITTKMVTIEKNLKKIKHNLIVFIQDYYSK